jgi:hypothetical protein
MKKTPLFFFLLSILIVACGTQGSVDEGTIPTIEPSLTAVPHITSTPPPHIDLPAVEPVDWNDVDHHAAAMRADYVSDIDDWVGGNRYYIQANLEFTPTAGIITAGQRTRFMNDTGDTLNDIVFRMYPNSPDLGGRMRIYDVTVDEQSVEGFYEQRNTVYRIPLPEPLQNGDAVEIVMDFITIAERGLNSSYGRYTFINDHLTIAGWHPVLAVYENGDWWTVAHLSGATDPHYAKTALYEVFVTHAEGLPFQISGVILETLENGDGTVTEHIATGPMRYSFLVAGGDMGTISEEADGTTVNVLYLPGDERGAEWILEVGVNSLKAFNEAYGDYPFAELDIVENVTPTGVEFPGLVIVAKNNWNAGSVGVEITTAHEVAHQWWYSLVHNDQPNHLWIDESLTSFSERTYLRYVYGEDSQRVLDHIQGSRSSYNGFRGTAGAVDFPMNTPADVLNQYQGGIFFVVYVKGRVFYGELRELIGPEAFMEGIRSYFEDNKYGIVNSGEIIQHMEAASGQELDAFFYEWVGEFEGLDPDVKAEIDSQDQRSN